MKNQEANLLEIDVLFLFKNLWRRKFIILITALLTTGLAFVYTTFLTVPQYDSTTRIYVVNQSIEGAQGLTNQELQAGSYLVKDYKEIILSQDVIRRVTEELGFEGEIIKKITVEIPIDTRIVSITVRDKDPNEAARIANTLRAIAAQKIIEVTKVSDVTTLEEALPAEHPSTPNTRRNLMFGFAGGAAAAIIFVLVVEVLDDRVKRPEDIEEMMGLPLLGVVPDTSKLK